MPFVNTSFSNILDYKLTEALNLSQFVFPNILDDKLTEAFITKAICVQKYFGRQID